MDAGRAIALALLLAAATVPAGGGALRLLGFRARDFAGRVEAVLVSAATGFGVFGYALTLLGQARLLYAPLALAVPLALAAGSLLFARPILARSCFRPASPYGCGETRSTDRPRRVERALWIVALAALGVLALAVLVQDLAPPTDYDGLLYHLVAPRAFLDAHDIVYIPHNFSANLPALGETLYTFSLAGGSDRAPQLLHGIAGALSVGLTYLLGQRCFSRSVALAGAAGLAATPLIPFLSTRAYIDLFTLLFALLSLLGFAGWRSSGRPPWLLLAGAGAGLALATKYAAASVAVVAGAGVLVAAWQRQVQSATCKVRPLVGAKHALEHRGAATAVTAHASLLPENGGWSPLVAAMGPALAFGLAAAVAAAPWYARQVVALGNPVWPMYFGGRDWDATRVQQLTYFVGQYGTGHSLRDWLLLPWNVYGQSWRFGHIPDSYPPLLALAAPLALLTPRGVVPWLWAGTAGLLAFWVRGWQDLRFLLPAYPLLALLGAAGLLAALRRVRWRGVALAAVLASLALGGAAREVRNAADTAGVVFGVEPVAAYLERRLPDQRAIEILNRTMQPGESALFLGDGQIWYCRQRCIPDPAHDNLLQWFVRPGSPAAALAGLRREGVSHILLSKRDYWYLEHQDPEDRLKRQLAQFYLFKAEYLDMEYEDGLTELYRGRW